MTRWEARTLDEQTAYISKTYARAPIQTTTGAIIHTQSAADVEFASAQFATWLTAVKAEAVGVVVAAIVEAAPPLNAEMSINGATGEPVEDRGMAAYVEGFRDAHSAAVAAAASFGENR